MEDVMTPYELWNTIINALIAIGTIGVVVLAIWGDWIRSRFLGPRLVLTLPNPYGSIVQWSDNKKSIFYHLVLINERSTVTAKRCRVILKKTWRKVPTGEFQELSLQVPLFLTWSPSEVNPPYVDVTKDQVLDFGYLKEGEGRFRPSLLTVPFSFEGYVQAQEVLRYGLEIVCDNFVSKRLQVYEVAWDGQWDATVEGMKKHLNIRQVKGGD
jgi:hypothetical protein